MNGWTITLDAPGTLALDGRALRPDAMVGLDAAAVARLPLGRGARRIEVGEVARIAPREDGTLVLDGRTEGVERIGWGMRQGELRIEGDAGAYVGALMQGGRISVRGDAGAFAGCEMAGGELRIGGRCGDHAASTRPGSMDGMRGGLMIVDGHAGARLADRMRRGTLIVRGDVGDFACSRLVAGTVVIGGATGAHPGYAMRRGTVIRLSGVDEAMLAPSFTPAFNDVPVFWQLLARSLAKQGGQLADLPRRPIRRWLGDLAVDGRGELIDAHG